MQPASRYAAMLQGGVRERPLLSPARHYSELELQAHWFAGDFGREFKATTGEAVRIVQFGVWNHEAGPDFADAAISLDGGAPVRGWIELDPDVRDWERHGHATNPAYDAVALHVFMQAGPGEFFTRTSSHRNVPQVHLDLAALEGNVLNAQPEAKPGRCLAPLRELEEEKVREVLLAAAEFRLRKKAAALARLVEAHGLDEALYQALAQTLGYKANKLPFTLLAQRLPLRQLRDGDAEALLFGTAGFLHATDLTEFEPQTRHYLRELWEQWWARRADFERLKLPPESWKLGGQRPANHPQRRLAALAQIVQQWPKIRRLQERCEPAEAHELFAQLRHDYWDFHYTVSSAPASRSMALVGATRVTEMLVNVFFPLAAIRGGKQVMDYRDLPASLTNRRVEIAALRLFGESERKAGLLKSAAVQQGLLQIYEDFCMRDDSDCAQCLFPAQLVKW